MFFRSLFAVPLLSSTCAALNPLSAEARSTGMACDGEKPTLTCYKGPSGTPQHVQPSDVAYVAAYLRAYGMQTRAGRLFTQSIANAPSCAEWTLYEHGTALATAKHIGSDLNSSVLYTDIANTIDGGPGATAAQKSKAIIGCGTHGGSFGVQYNASNPAYNSTLNPIYPDGYTPGGILIKIVSSNGTVATEVEIAS